MGDQVLIVSADAKLKGLVTPLLEGLGFEPKAFATIVEAAKAFAAGITPALIILDRDQPQGQSAYVFLRQLKADGVQTPVVVVASGASAEDLLAGFRLGAVEVLRKPTRAGVIRAMLTRVMPPADAPEES